MPYAARIRDCLTPAERRLFAGLRRPESIQTYLEALPVNFEPLGDTLMSPRRLIEAHSAHCIEGALFAAAALAYHGFRPLLMDFQTTPDDEDHVIALFRRNGYWGAMSKTNHGILRYRDALYRTPRELAMSYFHEYLQWDGRKTLRAYSAPFDLSRYAPEQWVTAGEDLDWVAEALDDSRHFPIAPKENMRALRKASRIELRMMKLTEWKPARRSRRGH